MIKIAELNYHCHTEFNRPEQAVEKHALSSGFIHFIKERVELVLVKHLNYSGQATIKDIRYGFFKSHNKFWHIPFSTHRFIKKEQPDIILVQGFVFVLQVMALRLLMGKNCIILVQHHGEKPFGGIKGFLQRQADRCINGYLFTAIGNADIWLNKKVISDKNKCFTILSASSNFTVKDKVVCKNIAGISGVKNFIWVARLNSNKDPFTVLIGFELYLTVNPAARLYMIYQTEELLEYCKAMIAASPLLKQAVHLIGQKEHHELEDWYNAADFYISGSHSEGSGYALVEAMACGCVPVVTRIPSFSQITDSGKFGFLFDPGNIADLYQKLQDTDTINLKQYAQSVHEYSKTALSYKAVADQIYQLASKLLAK
jgi:glycosyltransferase involved in cell wall biosynthesis